MIKQIKTFENSDAFLATNGGIIIGHPNYEFIGKTIEEFIPNLNEEFMIQDRVKLGESFSFTFENENHEKFFSVFLKK